MSGTRDNRRLIFGALAGFVCALILVGSMVTQAAAAPHAGTNAPPIVGVNGVGKSGNGNGPGVSTPMKPGSVPNVADAYAHLVPGPVVTVTLGTTFTFDLNINSGSNIVVGQQSYLTFTNSLLQVINPQQAGCVLATTITRDASTFEVQLQNVVDNSTGQIAYASGTFGSGVGPGADFRVARISFCPSAPGDAIIHWQFSPPAPPNRSSKITDDNSAEVENPALYTDVLVHIIAPPTVTPTATNTPTPSATYVGGGVLGNDLQLSSAPGVGSLNATIAGQPFGTGGYILLNYNNPNPVSSPFPTSPNANDYALLSAPFSGVTATISRGSQLAGRQAAVRSGSSAFIDNGTHYFSGLYDAGPDGSGNTIIINLSGLPTTPIHVTIYTNNGPSDGARSGTLSIFNGVNGGPVAVSYGAGQGAVEQWLLSGSSTATIYESNGAPPGNLPVGGILFDPEPIVTATPTSTSTPTQTATSTPTATSTWVQWTATPTPSPFGAALAAPGLYFNGGSSQVFAGGANGVKAAFDGATGNQLWSVSVGGAVYNRGPIVPIGGTNVVLFTSGDGYVNALRASDGTSFWAGGGTNIGTSAAAGPAYGPGQGSSGEDLVFAGTNENGTSNKFVALNAATGAQAWPTPFSGGLGPVTTAPAVDLANHRVFFGTTNASGSGGGIWALDTRTGALLWGRQDLGPDIASSPTLSDDGSTLYVALGTSPSLYALNTADGTLKNGWTPFSAGGAQFEGAPWLDGSYVYTTAGNSLYALDLTGAPKPGWTAPTVPGAGTPLVLSDSHQAIYMGSSSGLFYKLNLSDGSIANTLDVGTGAAVSNATYDVLRNAFYITSGGRLFSIAGNW